MVFHGSLNERKSPQVSRTFLNILADLNNAVVWMVSTCSIIFVSSSLSSYPLVTVPSAPIRTSVTVIFMFHAFFCSLAKSWYLTVL